MIIFIESRLEVGDAFISGFRREGVAVALITPDDAIEWFSAASLQDKGAVEGVLLGAGGHCGALVKSLRKHCAKPVIALSERRSLDETLELFGFGVDDVVPKPVHARELLARLKVIDLREKPASVRVATKDIVLFIDGRDPLVGGVPLVLPRRERRILECLADARGGWLTKTQIFNNVYGLFNENIDETVVESHISRLRKRLRERLGRDTVASQRHLGYRLAAADVAAYTGPAPFRARSEQAECVA